MATRSLFDPGDYSVPTDPNIDAGPGLLNLAYDVAAAGGGTILIATAYRVKSAFTAPAGVQWLILLGSRLSVDTGVTVTLNGGVATAGEGRSTVFPGAGTVVTNGLFVVTGGSNTTAIATTAPVAVDTAAVAGSTGQASDAGHVHTLAAGVATGAALGVDVLKAGGAAGGSLSGTYPNPTLAAGAATGAALGSDVIKVGTAPASGGLAGTYPNPTLRAGAATGAALGADVITTDTALGGSLTGTLPNPGLNIGSIPANALPASAIQTTTALGGVLAGFLPSPSFASAIPAGSLPGSVIQTTTAMSGVLTGNLPTPGLAAGVATGAVLGSDVVKTGTTAGGALTGSYPNPGLAAGVATGAALGTDVLKVGATAGGSLSGSYPSPVVAAGAVTASMLAAHAATGAALGTDVVTTAATVAGVLTGSLLTPGLAAGVATGAALGSDVATLTGAQTLTNKTLTAPTINGGVTATGAGSGPGVTAVSTGSNQALKVSDTGVSGANLLLAGDGATTPNKFLRAHAGHLQVLDHFYATTLLDMDNAGNTTLAGTFAAGTITGTLAAGIATGAALGPDVATLTGVQALTNKTLDSTSNAPVRLAKVTLGAAGTITFGSGLTLPQGYSHLMIVGQVRGTHTSTTSALQMRLNNDFATLCDWQLLQATGVAAPTSIEAEGQGTIAVGIIPAASAPAGVFGPVRIDLPCYSVTTANKSAMVEASAKAGTGAGSLTVQKGAGWWRGNGAITQIDLFPDLNSLDVGSVLELIAYP